MVLHSKADWTAYFHTINIPDDASTTYAAIFHENRMTDEILADTTANECSTMHVMNALQCNETVQNNLVNTTTDFFSLPEHNLLDTLETIVAKKSNQAVYQLTFSSLFQSEGESVTDFVV